MEDFLSEELNNARLSPSSLTEPIRNQIDIASLKNDLKVFVITKDKTLLRPYDIASLSRYNTASGNEILRSFLSIVRDFYTNKYREDNIKNIFIRKNIDIIFLTLDNLLINNIDISSNEMNALMVSFISKNFL